ncbi:L1 [Puffin papillomavirus 1]|uniref:Major capsid protein L1 n=1 Tax=Puffin papillomavirus 1 TaxID=2562557 RepID=A0AAE5YM51_9PAPI|nr:L1 [Puffin papillomavirus 1]QBR99487.1 L1 [Puffin papillomavirus 1]QBR99488.1 L1 [Puffin papillomavirus 1]
MNPLPPVLYIPSTQPQPTYFSTDDFVEQTQYVYHCGTDRLLTVGHPYFQVTKDDTVIVPKVSPNQYRCFRLKLPDPNGQFQMPANDVADPDRYRLVWQVVGVEVTRGQPLGIGLSAAPLFNRQRDVENPSRNNNGGDERINTAMDPKQNQMLLVGCAPAFGEHWSIAQPCTDPAPDTDCPPIELTSTVIEDGDMGDIGFGAMDYKDLCRNRSDLPLELVNSVSKYPDWIRMRTDPTGDSCFYMVRREQMYCRRLWLHGGNAGEKIPETTYRGAAGPKYAGEDNCAYLTVPSGSVSTTDTQLFNRPYWLSQAQGHNNGVCWADNLFVTVLDNTRGGTLHITHVASGSSSAETTRQYDVKNYTEYQRHVEEYEICVLLRLCRVPLKTEILAHIYRHNPYVLSRWGISEHPSGSVRAEDKYRYLESQATRCPMPLTPPPPSEDPYDSYRFWTIDCSDRMSLDLPFFPLGRKFLSLLPYGGSRSVSRKRPASSALSSPSVSGPRRTKRRRTGR